MLLLLVAGLGFLVAGFGFHTQLLAEISLAVLIGMLVLMLGDIWSTR